MKEFIVGLVFVMVFGLVGVGLAADPAGTLPGAAPQTADDSAAVDATYCAAFNHDGYNFVLGVNTSGPSTTGGDWCQDWAPTGSVKVKKNTVVKFNLSGTKATDACCDTINVSGKIKYKGSKPKKAKITWSYPSADCGWGPWTYKGPFSGC
jgi:hypothetical protein